MGEFSRREPIARKAAHAMDPGLILVLTTLIIKTQNYKKSPFHRVLELKLVEIVHLIVDFLTPFAIFEHLITYYKNMQFLFGYFANLLYICAQELN